MGRTNSKKQQIISKGNIVVVVEREKKSLLYMKKASPYRLLARTDRSTVPCDGGRLSTCYNTKTHRVGREATTSFNIMHNITVGS